MLLHSCRQKDSDANSSHGLMRDLVVDQSQHESSSSDRTIRPRKERARP